MTAAVAAAFSRRTDGDLRQDLDARGRFAEKLAAPGAWATLRQVHGNRVVRVGGPGDAGEADAMFTTVPGLALSVFTADCAGIVVAADRGVGVAHAGWRGALAGILPALVGAMTDAGLDIVSARIGPSIGPCCFEVGDEVAAGFGQFRSTTSWGTTSVDLRRFLVAQLPSCPTEIDDSCTYHDDRNWSHRRDGGPERMAAVGWLQ